MRSPKLTSTVAVNVEVPSVVKVTVVEPPSAPCEAVKPEKLLRPEFNAIEAETGSPEGADTWAAYGIVGEVTTSVNS